MPSAVWLLGIGLGQNCYKPTYKVLQYIVAKTGEEINLNFTNSEFRADSIARNAKPFHFIGTSPLPLIQPSSYAQSSSKDQSDTSASRQISCPSCAMKNYESSCRHRQDGAADEVHPFGKSNRSQHTIHCRWSDTGPEDEYVQITPCSYIRFVVELPSIQWMKWTGNHYSIILRNVLVKLLFFCPKDSRSYCFWLYLENVRCIINIVGVYKWKKTSQNI